MCLYIYKRRLLGLFVCGLIIAAIISWILAISQYVDVKKSQTQWTSDKHINGSLDASLSPGETYSFKHTCSQKAKNIFFLKVHKAASSTSQNIFLRYALMNGLNVALPNNLIGSFHIIGSKVFREKLIPTPVNETYHILCNHLVYNNSMIKNIMPPGTFYVGIVRDPIKHFASGLRYFGFMKRIQEKLYSINLNLSNEEAILYYSRERESFNRLGLYINNLQSRDYGLKMDDFGKDNIIAMLVENIDKEFDYIMLAEYYDESVVLLKRYLCWELKDILYVNKLVASDEKKESVNFMDNPKIISWLKVWNKADFVLYKHFQNKFWTLVHEQGRFFFMEVQYFVSVRERVLNFCKNKHPEIDYVSINKSRWNEEFYVDRHDCEIMLNTEKQLLKHMMLQAASKVNYTFPKS